MRVEVLFFAQFKDAFGSDAETMELQDGGTVADVVRVLRRRESWASVASIPLAFAVNERMVGRDHPLTNGDRVALLSPVSGG